ncbi:MAG: polysaccharide deacetylase family protein [Pygmaiobacter sp.]
MQIGSVQFFKRLILFTLALLILVPLICSLVFGIGFSMRGREVSRLSGELEQVSDELLERQLSVEAILTDKRSARGAAIPAPASSALQALYPDMVVDAPAEYRDVPKTVYLTFDDGPSTQTVKNLDLLAKEQIKATFVTGKNSEAHPEIIKRIVAEGHTLGVHTYSHNYREIYASVEAYLDDFYKLWSYLDETTGVKPTVFRFAGGSINVYNRDIYQEIVAEMLRRGFTYYDWNVSAGDAANHVSGAEILQNVVNGVPKHDMAVVLMHDCANDAATGNMLGEIIQSARVAGYRFDRLDNTVRPTTFAYGR